jgi:hypothetical protein
MSQIIDNEIDHIDFPNHVQGMLQKCRLVKHLRRDICNEHSIPSIRTNLITSLIFVSRKVELRQIW